MGAWVPSPPNNFSIKNTFTKQLKQIHNFEHFDFWVAVTLKPLVFHRKNTDFQNQAFCKTIKKTITNGFYSTSHKNITWDEFKKKPSHWFVNHSAMCYKKGAVLIAGNYNESLNKRIYRIIKTNGACIKFYLREFV